MRSIDGASDSETASRPSVLHSGTNGPASSISSGPMLGMFTAFETTPPVSAATTCSATCTPARSCASVVEAPRCGVTITLGHAEQRVLGDRLLAEDVEAAPATLPERARRPARRRRAAAPRAQLITRTPSFIFANASAFKPVLGLRRLRQVDRDDVGARVEVVGGPRHARRPARDTLGGDERVVGDDPHVEALGALATSWPMRPKPRMPSVFSYTSMPPNLERSQLAARRAPRAPAGCCAPARASARPCARRPRSMFDCGAFATMMPRLVAAGMSTLSTPDAGAADHLHPVGALDHVGGDLRGRADHDRVVVADPLARARRPPSRRRGRRRSARAGDRRRSRRSSPLRGRAGGRSRRGCAAAGTPASRNTPCAAATPAPSVDVVAELAQRHLERGDRGEDVERRRSSRMWAIRSDLALQLVLAAGDRDAVLVAHRLRAPWRRRCPRAA